MAAMMSSVLPRALAAAAAGNYTKLSDAIPQLENLTFSSPSTYPPQFGGMNLTHCCLLAINASFDIQDGVLALVANHFLSPDTTVSSFLAAVESGQFPCGATFNGNLAGAPIVRGRYEWTKDVCPGWQVSQTTALQQWIGPMVGFILTSLVFCLSIPRRRKLEISSKLFMRPASKRWGKGGDFLFGLVGFLWAVILVTVDTLLWLALCFAFAGPMILSGVYEALLDHRILKVLDETSSLETDMKVRLLFIILVGNLDLGGNGALQPNDEESGSEECPWDDVEELVSATEEPKYAKKQETDDLERKNHSNKENVIEIETKEPLVEEAAKDVAQNDSANKEDTAELGQPHLVAAEVPHERGRLDSEATIVAAEEISVVEEVASRPEQQEKTKTEDMRRRNQVIERTKTRLRTMLGTQTSFGMAVGAPIVFFAGAFMYTVFDILSRLGDNDTAHALAFGMWWMIIPHIAIISSLLLAGNNPNAFEGIVGKPIIEHPPVFRIFALSFPSRYKTEWMWLRGRSKQQWVQKSLLENKSGSIVDLYRATTFKILDWAIIISVTVILIAAPALFAFLTSFYTPRIGLSCRSLTFMVYGLAQTLQIALWVWVHIASCTDSRGVRHSPIKWTPGPISNNSCFMIWWTLAVIFGVTSVFTAIGGTIMQLLGVYRNCLCALPIQYWEDRGNADAWVSLGTNSADDIMAAKRWWVPLGSAAVAFLCLSCYLGWWYQRWLRGVFRNATERV